MSDLPKRIQDKITEWKQDGTADAFNALMSKVNKPAVKWPCHDDGDEGRGLTGRKGVL